MWSLEGGSWDGSFTCQVEADGGPPKQFVKAIGALEDYIEPSGGSVKHTEVG